MERDRPPEVDAEYRLVRGPWPRWMLHIGLLGLAIRTAAVVALCIGLMIVVILVVRLG